jgi:hypothetical protein
MDGSKSMELTCASFLLLAVDVTGCRQQMRYLINVSWLGKQRTGEATGLTSTSEVSGEGNPHY